jgi:outer membrane lipoprotein-sorting protein
VTKFFTGSELDTVSVLDGKNAWAYAPKLKQYMKEADSDASEFIGYISKNAFLTMAPSLRKVTWQRF